MGTGSFLILGSGGLWATLAERTAANWVGRHFDDAQDAAESLTSEALARWENPSSKARAALKDDISDCFSCLLFHLNDNHDPRASSIAQTPRSTQQTALALTDPGVQRLPPLSARRFVMGAHQTQETRSWAEVKSGDRTLALRRTQAHGRQLGEDLASTF